MSSKGTTPHLWLVKSPVNCSVKQVIHANGGKIFYEAFEGLYQIHEHHIVECDEVPVPHCRIVTSIF